jgi:hypothetical protein
MTPRSRRFATAAVASISRLAAARPPRQLVIAAAVTLGIGWAVTIASWFVPNGTNGGIRFLIFVVATLLFAAAVVVGMALAASALAASAIGTWRARQPNVYSPLIPRWVPRLGVMLIVLAPGSFVFGELISIITAVS